MTRKYEPPLYLAMDTDEALARFVQTKPSEVEELQAKKAAGPPIPRRPKDASKAKSEKP